MLLRSHQYCSNERTFQLVRIIFQILAGDKVILAGKGSRYRCEPSQAIVFVSRRSSKAQLDSFFGLGASFTKFFNAEGKGALKGTDVKLEDHFGVDMHVVVRLHHGREEAAASGLVQSQDMVSGLGSTAMIWVRRPSIQRSARSEGK